MHATMSSGFRRIGSSGSAHRRDRAFTLVELLVVIAVIAVLVGLLVPAVIQSRGAARRSQCASNLKQLASAVQQFHNRMDSLPIYWGAMKSGGGELFGGWLAHMLPELDEAAFYDSLPRSGTSTRLLYAWQDFGYNLPAVDPTPDWNPGSWVTGTTMVTMAGGGVIAVTTNTLVGRRGRPGYPERRAWGWRVVGSAGMTSGLPATFGQAQSVKSLGFLQCGDDPSPTPPNAMIPVGTVVGTATTSTPWSLTNYQANAHVFLKFCSPRIGPTAASQTMGYYWNVLVPSLATNAGLFLPPVAQTSQGTAWSNVASGLYSHANAANTGTLPRTLGHVTDGLSNTIMFGEGMRQCDGGAVYRFAFLPAGRATHEHSFGIEPSFTGTNSTTILNGSIGPIFPTQLYPAGNTLRFQARPAVSMCNSFRVQGNHGGYLMTAMCDGSIRAISSAVDAREQVSADASGRDNYGTRYYTAESRGGNLPPQENPDGIWDMLMVPSDPPQNVLRNSGEIGKERRY